MQRELSSSVTVWWKFIFPALWIAGLGTGTAKLWLGDFHTLNGQAPPDWVRWLVLGIWLAASTFLTWFGRQLRRVSLHDGVLIVSNFFREISVPVGAITRVTQSYMSRPPTITIHLDDRTSLGDRIVFVPAGPNHYLSEHPTTTELKAILAATNKDLHANA